MTHPFLLCPQEVTSAEGCAADTAFPDMGQGRIMVTEHYDKQALRHVTKLLNVSYEGRKVFG